MYSKVCISACLLLTTLLTIPVAAQESCPALTVPKIVPGTNIFSEQQEMWLGDAEAAQIEQSITVIDDPALTGYLQGMVDRLAKNLPPNQIQFRVKLIDVPTADAFSIAGGRIYISRKIINVTVSEDEVAGLLAHEMGHIVAHHAATEMSDRFRKVLGVTQVGDSADISAKWNRYLSNYRRQKMSSGAYQKSYEIEEKEQVQADTIALYLVARAGYSTQAFEQFFNRLAETKGNTGSFWSDFFGTTKPDSKRLRQIIKNMPAVPPACTNKVTTTAAGFDQWKRSVIDYSATNVAHQENLPGLISKMVLTERLRPQVLHIRISPNGQYVLVQDDSNVFVLTRQPFKAVFRFDAPDAEPAQFTPDSREIYLLFAPAGASPRVEAWDIASQKRTETHEVYVGSGCLVSVLSPDGKTLVCLTPEDEERSLVLDLAMYDTAAGTEFWRRKSWAWLSFSRFFFLSRTQLEWLLPGMLRTAFSPDSHYVIVRSQQNLVCLDLTTRSPKELPGGLRSLLAYDFTFLADGHLMGISGRQGEKSAVVEFPSGQVVQKDLMTGLSVVSPVAHGDHVLLRPIKDNPLGVFDLKQNKIVLASKISAMDFWDDTYVAERDDGDVELYQLNPLQGIATAQLPNANLGAVRAAALSPDLRWMAISQASRGAVWDMKTGQRLYHLRGFRGACFSPDGAMYADFPKHLQTERLIARASLTKADIHPERTVDVKDGGSEVEIGRYLLVIEPTEEKRPSSGVTIKLREVADNHEVWTKQYPDAYFQTLADPEANSLILRWPASEATRVLGKGDPQIAAKLAPYKNKDGIDLLQILELDTGRLRAQVAVDSGKRSFQMRDAIATEDRLIIADDKNRVLVYSFDGQEKGIITGHAPEVSAGADLLTVRTESGKLELYDVADMQKRNTYDFGSYLAFNGFSGDGKRLLVLTSDQVVYVLDSSGKGSVKSAAAQADKSSF